MKEVEVPHDIGSTIFLSARWNTVDEIEDEPGKTHDETAKKSPESALIKNKSPTLKSKCLHRLTDHSLY